MIAQPRLSLAILTGSISRSAGGLFNSVRRGAIALDEAGCRVRVLAVADAHAAEDLAAWCPLKPQLFEARGPRSIAFAPGLFETLETGSDDVVHLHGIWQHLSISTSRWRRRTGRPVMISPRGMLDPWALRNVGWKKQIARVLFEDANLRGATCMHALNQPEADAMRAFGLTNPIAIIPNGTDLADAKATFDRPAWLPDDGRKTLLFLGRLHPKKGLREMAAAWAELKQRAPDVARAWRLVIAGWDDGGHVPALSREITAAGLEADILVPGSMFGDAKAALLAASDAFILPSYSEGLPMSVLEAWAYGLPVFMTAACNLPEGFAVDAAVEISVEPSEMARMLARYLGDGALAGYGARGQVLVTERFAWPQIAAQHVEVYNWMRCGGQAPECVQTI
jgi:glycosyltransferase involved in cell wall biosynthesis